MFLDNVHLMQGWIPRLERKLEVAAESAHPDFRCFFSAEPINGAPQAKIIPESILQTCIKISNEPPSDMKSNMRWEPQCWQEGLACAWQLAVGVLCIGYTHQGSSHKRHCTLCMW